MKKIRRKSKYSKLKNSIIHVCVQIKWLYRLLKLIGKSFSIFIVQEIAEINPGLKIGLKLMVLNARRIHCGKDFFFIPSQEIFE